MSSENLEQVTRSASRVRQTDSVTQTVPTKADKGCQTDSAGFQGKGRHGCERKPRVENDYNLDPTMKK